jgi:hypothetical protein
MGKFCGPIGFIDSVETRPGVFVDTPVEHVYKGDVINRSFRIQNGISVNDTVTVSNQISIVADPYARNHFHSLKYVKWMCTAWEVTNVSEQYPRLLITIGGKYNGKTV